ncbi:conserved Plasmodium protein, unknown function [Plasmodium ovale curtisi]|uniref:Uncharacterized protein n=1 Tax=Plasmodium ovale curtisi TaxID=864141 RepID=A0A1A8VK68_PLAOA|nr:conserved Plasmodium protein, unknown function [Plasmodium ovale curtisi]
MENKDTVGGKNKDEEILRLRKLAAIFKNECKKLKEENDTLKKGTFVNKNDCSDDKKSCSTGDEEDIVAKFNNEFSRRIIIERSYRKLKDFTLLLEEKHRNLKKENNEKCKILEDKLNDCIKDLNLCKNENKKLEEKIKEKDEDIDKLKNKIDEYKLYFNSEKNVMNCLENSIDETVQYKLEIKKLKENLEMLKKNDDITSKERQQYKSIIMLCSQYKEKCKVIPVLEAKIDVLESKVKELDVYRHRDMEKIEDIKELKNTILNHQIENNKLMQQLNEWTNFSKLYINSNTVNIDSLKQSMNQIHNKYNQVNYTKIDLEIKFKKLSTDLQLEKQKLEDKNLEVKILKNKNSQLEKKYNFLKKDYLYEVNKNKAASLEESNNIEKDLKGKNYINAEVGQTGTQTDTQTGTQTGTQTDTQTGTQTGIQTDTQTEHTSNEMGREMGREMENLVRMINEYKAKYDSVKKDNNEKEKLIEEVNEKLKKYKNDYERFYLKQKCVDTYSQEILIYKNEIKYLKEESEDYKNKIFKLENDLILVKNMWKNDNEKNEIIIKNLKDTIKKIQFNIKINNSTNKLKKDMSNIMNNKNDIHILYKDLENIKCIDELEFCNIRNENVYLKSKMEIMKLFYSNQIKTYREAFLYILGWDIQIEENNEDIFFILTSLFSTHDGKFIFIKNKCSNEKRSYQTFSEICDHSKRVKLSQGDETDKHSVSGKAEEHPVSGKAEEHPVSGKAEEHSVSGKAEEHSVSGKAEEHPVSGKAEEHPVSGKSEEHPVSGKAEEHPVSGKLEEHPVSGKAEEHPVSGKAEEHPVSGKSEEHPVSGKSEEHPVSGKSEEHPISSEADFYEGLIGECNEINTNAVIEKSQLENTNMNMSTIMKGCKYNLLLHGYYGIKWKENTEWKNYLNKMNTYPILLALSCMEEYNNIKSQYRNCLSKNCKGMLFKI